jgi:hypothetical protein
LFHGQSGARHWRRLLSDPGRLSAGDASVLFEALALMEEDTAAA